MPNAARGDDDPHTRRPMNGNPAPEQPGVFTYFWLNSLENLLNAFVELDPVFQRQTAVLDGLVVRVKTFAPYQVFYLLFTADRIEVSPKPQGEVRVRLSGRVQDLVWNFLGLGSEERAEAKGNLNLWGDSETTTNLRLWLREFNLRTAAGHWLKGHWPMNNLWQKLGDQDLSWLEDLQPLPGMIRQTREELRGLQGRVEQQEIDLRSLRRDVARQMLYIRGMLAVMLVFVGIGIGLLAARIGA